ncbi:glycosyltransferase family 2 protein [Candidatus Woesearchaeota archaeon]|nr:glycosyltransferase family 2 protein [Candidatus Woesearchaeota archaeon]
MKRLTILIVNYKNSRDTVELIENLKYSTFNDFNIVVWDNNSPRDEFFKRLEENKEIRLIKNDKNIGLTGAVNESLRHITTRYVLLLNPDIIIDKNAVKELLDLIESDEKIAFVGGSIYSFINKDKIDAFGGKINFFTGIGKPLKNENKIRELKFGEYCDACILMFNKDIFEELGKYDNRFFAYAETEDVLFMAMKKGYKVMINPKAKVWHKQYGSSGGEKNKFVVYQLTRNRFLMMKKNVNALRFFLFLIINFLLIFPVQFFLFIFRKQFGLIPSFLKGIFDGLIGRY